MLNFFYNPEILLWLPAVGIPLLIYLLYRQRYKRIEWAAMEFLLRALKKNRRRLRIENLLILILRMLVILFLVAGFTRPLLRSQMSADSSEKRINAALVLDQSYSMAYKPGTGTSAMEKARIAAKKLLKSLRDNDRVTLSTAGEWPTVLYETPVSLNKERRGRVEVAIGDIRTDHGSLELGGSLSALGKTLDAFGTENQKQLFLFTDMQRNSWLDAQGRFRQSVQKAIQQLIKKKTALRIIDVGDDDFKNAAITDFRTDKQTLGVGIPFRFQISVQNFSDDVMVGLSLEVEVDNTRLTPKPLTLNPGEQRQLELAHNFNEAGIHKARAVLRSDALPVDNERDLALEVRQSIRILLVDGDPRIGGDAIYGETHYFEQTLAPSEQRADERALVESINRVTKITDLSLEDEDLDGYDVIILCDVSTLEGQVERLESFVRNGGGLWFFLGDQIDVESYNRLLFKDGSGLLPGKIGELRGDSSGENAFVMQPTSWNQPGFRKFDDDEFRPLVGNVFFLHYFPVDVDESDVRNSVMARFEVATESRDFEKIAEKSGDPAFVLRDFGRGKVVLATSSAGADWSTFSYSGVGFVFADELIKEMLQSATDRRNLLLCEPIDEIIPSTDFASEVVIETPARDKLDPEASRDQIVLELTQLVSLNHATAKDLELVGFKPENIDEILSKQQAGGFLSVAEIADLATMRDAPELFLAVAPKLSVEKDQFRLYYDGTKLAGVYDVDFRGIEGESRKDYFAVTVDPKEGDLKRIVDDEIQSAFPRLDLEVLTPGELTVEIEGKEGDIADYEIWWPLIFTAFCLKLLESTLSLFFGWRKSW